MEYQIYYFILHFYLYRWQQKSEKVMPLAIKIHFDHQNIDTFKKSKKWQFLLAYQFPKGSFLAKQQKIGDVVSGR